MGRLEPVFEEVAAFASIVTYDRAANQGSEPGGQGPTPQHVAVNLHGLL